MRKIDRMMYFHLLVKMRNPHCGCILILLSFIANKQDPHCGCILILLSFIANKQDFILRISARAFFWNGPSISDNFNIWCSFEWRFMIRWKAFHTAMLLWDNRQWTVVSILFLNNWVCLSTKGTFKADQPLFFNVFFFIFESCSTCVRVMWLSQVSDWSNLGKYEKEDTIRVLQKKSTRENLSNKCLHTWWYQGRSYLPCNHTSLEPESGKVFQKRVTQEDFSNKGPVVAY